MCSISVILPFYNAEVGLKGAIQSILNQTYQDFELILVNNNSSDKSFEIVSHLAHEDLRIKLVAETKQGVVHAANNGMKAAKGKYIARMDADDIAHPERLKQQFRHLEQNPQVSISTSKVKYKTKEDGLTEFSHFVDWSNQLISTHDIYHNRFVEFPIVNPTLLFRRSIIDKIGYLKNGHFPEDYEWFLRAIDRGYLLEKLPIPLLEWNDSSSRITRTDSRYNSDAFFNVKTNYLAKHLNKIKQTHVWIWGAGKLAIKRSQLLLNYDIKIHGYIDIKNNKEVVDYPCIHFEDLDINTQTFVIRYVTNRNKRDEIRAFLNSKGYQEGINYIIAG